MLKHFQRSFPVKRVNVAEFGHVGFPIHKGDSELVVPVFIVSSVRGPRDFLDPAKTPFIAESGGSMSTEPGQLILHRTESGRHHRNLVNSQQLTQSRCFFAYVDIFYQFGRGFLRRS